MHMPPSPAVLRHLPSEGSNSNNAALIGANRAFIQTLSIGKDTPLAASPQLIRSKKVLTSNTSYAHGDFVSIETSMAKNDATWHTTHKVEGARGAWVTAQKERSHFTGQAQHPRLQNLSKDAAQLAASRSSSPEQNGPVTSVRSTSRQSVRESTHSGSSLGKGDRAVVHRASQPSPDVLPQPGAPTDSTSIAPTSTLVGLFERKSSNLESPTTPSKPLVIRPSADLTLQSPKPLRATDAVNNPTQFTLNLEAASPDDKAGTGHVKERTRALSESRQPSSDNTNLTSSGASGLRESINTGQQRIARSGTISPSDTRLDIGRAVDPSASTRLPGTKHHEDKQSRTGSLLATLPSQTSVAQKPGQSITAQYNQIYTRRMTPLNTGDQLANAIVASSLASSRCASPRRLEPSSVPLRRPKSSTFGVSRTPSPAKHTMLHTLRPTDTSNSDGSQDERHSHKKHRKRRLVRKHPHKHHEGDRKRWRDAVTEREQKRYDGVWAANRGLHCELMPSTKGRALDRTQTQTMTSSLPDRVSNLVVKDMWNRSRLPESVLEAIWDLVDGDCIGRLTKDEFVVGLWLIDQRLKGRKLPVKVSESVWVSVRQLRGIKIRR